MKKCEDDINNEEYYEKEFNFIILTDYWNDVIIVQCSALHC